MIRSLTTALAIVALVAFAGCKKKEEKKKTPKPTPKAGVTKPTPKPAPTAKADPALVARGKYLANVLACNLCHTPMGPRGPIMEKAWAGGFRMKEKFGEWVSPNITPDVKTGIGGWSDAEIIAAVRTGVRKDGTKLKPIMPYPFYSQMTDEDAKALVTYLRALKPIENKVERVELKIPHIPAPPAKDYKGKQGEYLATIMHCAACHVPTDKTGMPDMKRAFAGGMKFELPPQMGTGHLYAPNISSDTKTGIGKWTVAQIATSIKAMTRPNGKPIMPPMAMYAAFWSKMTDEDVTAVATFIKGLPPQVNKVPPSTFKPNAMGPPGGKPPTGKAPAKTPPGKDHKPGKSSK